ncbi:MAG TPA: DUF4178 domain-containing protein [Candidatus Angelobacter sp.]|jgi:hypothetical protein|nr:DUF4178 domain-containing protein [Candidatus Angelobacter sp.]
MAETGPKKEVPTVIVRSLSCPGCGATVTIRSFGQAVNVVCGSCHSILDAQDPNVQILQKFSAAMKFQPLIPLGSRGKLRGTAYEVIGFQRRQITVDGDKYSWGEYVLFNPYKGFRYLTEYDGHWNDVAPLRTLPNTTVVTGPVNYLGQTYKHFQTCQAATVFVIGEFPWQVRVGETVTVSDYVAPPRVLSSETTGDKEVTWSLGEYLNGGELWKAFSLPGKPPAPIGVYENQPSPLSATSRGIWRTCALLIMGALLLYVVNAVLSKDKTVFTQSYNFYTNDPVGEHSFVTEPFEFTGARAAPVRVETNADVDNNWIYLNYALVNEDSGQTYDFGREISYYYGRDSDGSWSEGSRRDSVIIPSVPPGHYFLRIEPESERKPGVISYTVTVTHDYPVGYWFLIAAGMLLVPAILITWRSMNFEHLRWQESDHSRSGLVSVLSSISSGGDE